MLIITETLSNIQKLLGIINLLDVESREAEVAVITLEKASAAALAKIRGQDYQAAATTRALSNGFASGVEVHQCDEPGLNPPCEGLPAGAVLSEYVQVVIRITTRTTFARIIGRDEVHSVVSAVARVQGSSSTSSSSSDAAMFATKDDASDQCFLMHGGNNLYLQIHGSGIFVNCSGAYALAMNGSTSLSMDTPGEVVGCHTPGFQATPGVNCNAAPRPIGSIFASVPTTQPPPACGSSAGSSGSVYTPGTFASISVSGSATMEPGVYCVGSFSVSGTLSAPNGKVQIVLQSGDITLTGGAVMNFADLEIYSTNAGVTMVGHSSIQAARLRYFSTGGGLFTIVGNGELTSGDAYFYFQQGNIDWSGDATLNLHGPPQGDPFGGLLIHKPLGNTTSVLLNGGTNTNLTGTFMVPGSHVRLIGNPGFELHSQLIGSTFEIGGSATVDIFYDPSENYQPPNSPTIQLTK